MIANEAQAKAGLRTLTGKYPDGTRKGWEARKKFAAECGVDVKRFNRGLGPQYDRVAGLVRGVKEVNATVPVDERSFKAFPTETSKLIQIIKTYRAQLQPPAKPADGVRYYGEFALLQGLGDMEKWATEAAKWAAAEAKKRPKR